MAADRGAAESGDRPLDMYLGREESGDRGLAALPVTEAQEFADRAALYVRQGPDEATVPLALTSIALSLAALPHGASGDRVAEDPRVAELAALVARWHADAEVTEHSDTSTKARRLLAAEVIRTCAAELSAALSSGLPQETAWRCDWTPDELNPGPECPYCTGEMCALFDGLHCTHDVIERHGLPTTPTPGGEE